MLSNNTSSYPLSSIFLSVFLGLIGGLIAIIPDTHADTASPPRAINPSLQQQAYLKASNTDMKDRFGFSMAISGDTMVIGAPFEASKAPGVNSDQTDDSAHQAGAVYVFTRSAGNWTQQAYLKASNAEAFDQFGFSVAIDGDTVVVGAPFEDSNARAVNGNQINNLATFAGAAYVFTRSAGSWTQQAYLKASNTDAFDQFGRSVAIDGDTVVVGAFSEKSNALGVNGDQNDNSLPQAGAAYVFNRSAGSWTQQAYLKASNTDESDLFGWAVAIDGDTAVVGAYGEASKARSVDGDQNDNSAVEAGAAYVFTRNAGSWTQQAYLKASNTDGGDQFGFSVAIDGNTVVAGAPFEDSNARAVDGNQINNMAAFAGAAYVFTRGAGNWSQQAYLKASNTDSDDRFGFSVAVHGNTVVSGAHSEASNASGVDANQNNNSAFQAGAAYVFTHNAGNWSQQAYLKASNTDGGDQFGGAVTIDGDTVAVGAQFESSSATGVNGNQTNNLAAFAGAAYVYVFDALFSVGGNLTGLAADATLVLQNNGGDDLALSADGQFTFPGALSDGSGYSVTVQTQPAGQTCTVSNGSGNINKTNVSNVAVNCASNLNSIFSDQFE